MLKMNRRAAGLLVLLAAATAACRDNPAGPQQNELTLQIRRGDLPFEEETLAPGETLVLEAAFLSSSGSSQSAGAVTWKSTNPTVATVDGNGRINALEVGTTRIIVSAGAKADTGIVNVAAPVSGSPTCAPGDPGLGMAVGDVRLFAGEEAMDLCLPAGLTNAGYLLVPFNASAASGARLNTELIASGGLAASSPSTSAAPVEPFVRQREIVPDDAFHLNHLRRSREEFESALGATSLSPAIAAQSTPAIGQYLRLNAATRAGSGCTNPDYRTGRVVAVSTHAIVVADTANPKNGFTQEDYETIARTFDNVIWPVDTQDFGEPSDIDENGHVIIFYTRAVNELTPSGSDSYVGGFFYNRDLFPTTGTNACEASNEAEMFYMLVPDPTGVVNGNERSREFVLERTYSVLAHEFQHLINDSRRLYVNDAPVWEDDWLNEGLSHIAEELAFYSASGHAPRQNLGTTPLTGEQARMFNRYNLDNFERYIRYLREPEEFSVIGNVDELGTRGATWAFLRYAADREPGEDAAMWRRLVNSKTAGLTNLEAALGVDPREWMHHWETSVYTDDAGFSVAQEYTQPSWNYRALTAIRDASGRFPLAVRTLPSTVLLDGGAGAFYQISVQPGTRRAVRATVDDLPPPSRLRLAVVRVN